MTARRRSKRLLGLGLAIVGLVLISLVGAAEQGSGGGNGDAGSGKGKGKAEEEDDREEPGSPMETHGPFSIKKPNFEYACHHTSALLEKVLVCSMLD